MYFKMFFFCVELVANWNIEYLKNLFNWILYQNVISQYVQMFYFDLHSASIAFMGVDPILTTMSCYEQLISPII